ncbi:hypothetical protein KP509_01G121800 [Ceratopteris richardii]|nr:hypothetical protein KP509_01G121800 [Ceratopteris richardii]
MCICQSSHTADDLEICYTPDVVESFNDWYNAKTKLQIRKDKTLKNAEQIGAHKIECECSGSNDYFSILRFCGASRNLYFGRQIHHDICCDCRENDTYAGGVLIEVYLKCLAVEDAYSIFLFLHVRSTFIWNLVIRSYTSQGQDAKALECFCRIYVEALLPDTYTYVSLLSSSANLADLETTRTIHVAVINQVDTFGIIVRNSLINAYNKCGTIKEAQRVFNMMVEKDSFSWDTLLGAYVQHKFHGEALFHVYEQQHQGVMPTKITYSSILDACIDQGHTNSYVYVLAQIFGSEFRDDIIVQTNLLHFFRKRSDSENLWKLFSDMSQRNSYSWNAIFAAYSGSVLKKGIFELYSQMLNEGIMPDEETVTRLISLSSDCKLLTLGKWLHACGINHRCDSTAAMGNALIGMYGKCVGLEEACRTFDWILEKTIVTWTTMVGVCVDHGQAVRALDLYQQMVAEGLLSDKIMLISLLNACASLQSSARLKQLHVRLIGMDLHSDLEMQTSLAILYGKCNSFKYAERMFDLIPDRSLQLWTASICAHAQHDRLEYAIHVFQQMMQEGTLPNEIAFFGVLEACGKLPFLIQGRRFHAHLSACEFGELLSTQTALIDMYGKCGSLEESQIISDVVKEQDIVSLTALMSTYAQNGKVKQALDLFDKAIQGGLMPDAVAYVNVLSMCSHAGLVDDGRRYFSSMCHHGVDPDIHHYSCMIDLYGRARCTDDAENVIKNMPVTATALQWLTLLTACRQQLDVQRGEHAARQVMLLEPKNPIPYIELSNIYSALNREPEAAAILNKAKELN